MVFHFVTVATKEDYFFPFLIESCNKNDIHLNVIGWGESYPSHMFKVKKIMEFIANLPDQDVIMLYGRV